MQPQVALAGRTAHREGLAEAPRDENLRRRRPPRPRPPRRLPARRDQLPDKGRLVDLAEISLDLAVDLAVELIRPVRQPEHLVRAWPDANPNITLTLTLT